jgi:hypothetical protein
MTDVRNYQSELNDIISKFRKKLTRDRIAELKNIGYVLEPGIALRGKIISLPLKEFQDKLSFLSNEISQILSMDIISHSLLLIIDKHSDMGMHTDDNCSNTSPRLLANISMPQDKQCCFEFKDKTFDLEEFNYLVFNATDIHHNAWNSSDTEWLLLVLNLENCLIVENYEIYG